MIGNKNENVCERNFDGRFSRELCWEIVQQFTSEGPMNCFGRLSNRFPSEICPMFYQYSVVCFQEQIAFILKTDYFTRILALACVRESVRTRNTRSVM